MKALRLHRRGGPEALSFDTDVAVPEPGAGEVRVRVRAAALTPGELGWDETYRNRDKSERIPATPGHDVCGIVDALGAGVSDLRTGEAVFGLVDFPLNGSAAEYVVMPAADVAAAPRSIDAVTAAAVPLSSLTAWQALFDHGQLVAGQRVLIHGAAGGVGAFAVQLAKWRGAHVIATASAKNVAAVRALGADEVIDYTAAAFESQVRDLDLVFDTVGGDTLARSYGVLHKGGRLVSVAQPPDQAKAVQHGVAAVFFIVRPSRAQLQQIAELIDGGHVRVQIEGTYPLAEGRSAFERVAAGHLRGKVVLVVEA